MALSGRLVTRQMGNCTVQAVRMEPLNYGKRVASHMDYGGSLSFSFEILD